MKEIKLEQILSASDSIGNGVNCRLDDDAAVAATAAAAAADSGIKVITITQHVCSLYMVTLRTISLSLY